MGSPGSFAAEPLTSARLQLEPLEVGHAAEAAVVLDDERLHTYIGGSPATIHRAGRQPGDAGELVAEAAWIVASAHQGNGYAGEAAAAMTGWLRERGVDRVVAQVHPRHEASMGVARSLRLSQTTTVVDGEVRWTN